METDTIIQSCPIFSLIGVKHPPESSKAVAETMSNIIILHLHAPANPGVLQTTGNPSKILLGWFHLLKGQNAV